MHLFFTSNESFSVVGVQLDLGDGPRVLFCQNKNLIADMAAAHATFDLRGSSGLTPCIKCANCVKKGALTDTAHPLPNPDGRLKDITSPILAAFVPNTNKAVFDNVDELQRLSLLVASKALTKGKFQLAAQACGLNYNPDGLLLDKQLRTHCQPLDMHTEDWAHVYLCNGVGGDELWHLLDRLKACGIKYDTFRSEMQLWTWPKHHTGGKGVWRLFSEKRAQANDEGWKSSAGEFLTIYPIVLDWVSTHVRKRLLGELNSWLAQNLWGAYPPRFQCPP